MTEEHVSNKEGDKTPEEPTEAQIGKLLEKEFRVMITTMIKEHGRRTDEHGEKFNIESEDMKN